MSITNLIDTDILVLRLLYYTDLLSVSLTCKDLYSLNVWPYLLQRDFGVSDANEADGASDAKSRYEYIANCQTVHKAATNGRLDALRYFHSLGVDNLHPVEILKGGHLHILDWILDKVDWEEIYCNYFPLRSILWMESKGIEIKFMHCVSILDPEVAVKYLPRNKAIYYAQKHRREDILISLGATTVELNYKIFELDHSGFNSTEFTIEAWRRSTLDDFNLALLSGDIKRIEKGARDNACWRTIIKVEPIIQCGIIPSILWCIRNEILDGTLQDIMSWRSERGERQTERVASEAGEANAIGTLHTLRFPM